jgi:hypothetical protein
MWNCKSYQDVGIDFPRSCNTVVTQPSCNNIAGLSYFSPLYIELFVSHHLILKFEYCPVNLLVIVKPLGSGNILPRSHTIIAT